MKKEDLKKILREKVLILDGAIGTELVRRGFSEFPPEVYLLRNKSALYEIQKEYVHAGCDIILTATLGANPIKLNSLELREKMEEINERAVEIARKATQRHTLIAGNIGPTGELFHPSGELTFSRAYDCFYEQAKILTKGEVDLFILETFSDMRELKAAFIAVRDIAPEIFVIVNATFDRNGKTLSGTDPIGFNLSFMDLDVDGLGVNCSLGPEEILPIFQELSRTTPKFLSVKPNAGIPEIREEHPFYKMEPETFVKFAEDFYELGANFIGGCCGTTPDHLKRIVETIGGKKPLGRTIEGTVGLSSLTKNVLFIDNSEPVVIGERINPSGKKRMTREIEKGKTNEILHEARRQADAGASILDVNLGLESSIEEEWIKNLITNLLISPGLPLSIDIRSTHLIEASLQEYGGRALLNSITMKDMEEKVKLLLRYGGMTVFLPVDEKGIPESSEGRISVVLKTIRSLEEMGFNRNRIIFDPIVMSLSTGNDPRITLETLKGLKSNNLLTIIGLSNISYGLPERESLNDFFLKLCSSFGLDAVIKNPLKRSSLEEIDYSDVFSGKKTIVEFIKEIKPKRRKTRKGEGGKESNLILESIISGEKEKVLAHVKKVLKKKDYKSVIEDILRPSLSEVGKRYEEREIFLPHLILAAETAQIAFDFIEKYYSEKKKGEGKVVIATVRGDIHDIGKNIVAMMLRNAGFEVIDLGKDVPSEDIIETVIKNDADLLALSALMTTTALKMREVIERAKERNVGAKVIIGGACITKSFSEEIGADAYGADASEAVRVAKQLIQSKK
jgi:5-methyltetrahydrofolate--homocysteine methyltransferase